MGSFLSAEVCELKLKTKVTPGKRHRKRKIIYYNPSFYISAKQNLGKLFFDLINKYFPVKPPFSKIFNNKSIKLSNCCLPDIKQIVQSHNRKLLRNDSTVDDCICLKKTNINARYPVNLTLKALYIKLP